jgi:hypothetical protein
LSQFEKSRDLCVKVLTRLDHHQNPGSSGTEEAEKTSDWVSRRRSRHQRREQTKLTAKHLIRLASKCAMFDDLQANAIRAGNSNVATLALRDSNTS